MTRSELKLEIQQGTFPIIIAFSGGKDSIALVLAMLQMGVSKDCIHLHHHEIDGGGEGLFDWECTPAYCKAFAEAMGIKIFFSYRKGGILREIYRQREGLQDVYFQKEPDGEFSVVPSDKSERYHNTRMKFPAVSANLATRWCSSIVKIEVMKRIIAHDPQYKNAQRLVILTGERREESNNRSKYQEIELHSTSTKNRQVHQWRAIIDLDEQEVWAKMQYYGIQPHPSYMLWWNRCSCKTCIFSSSDIWASIKAIDEKKVERFAEIEKDLGFTLYDKKTINQKVQSGTSILDMTNPETQKWIKVANSTKWDLPIIIDDWQLPKGAFKHHSAGAV